MNKSRREFLQSTGLCLAGVSLLGTYGSPEVFSNSTMEGNRSLKRLKGFIVSDAHFGWEHKMQPSPEHVRGIMQGILTRFPDLDLFIDTGDAYHGISSDADRGDWTECIANMCRNIPLFYTPGNHEVVGEGNCDLEMRANRVGSLNCRPYYSYDLKGIHFISLPELLNDSFVTDETLLWARLDLERNKDRTCLIMSHNSISDTTQSHDDAGYRRVVNSDQLQELMQDFPNVIAWMHGHNHTWEIVPWENRLYVSNGRIGGYDPVAFPGFYGAGHLGGIYFEVDPSGLTVRGYSASQECFFDELPNYGHLTQRLEIPTSFDPNGSPAVSFGYGGARDGQRTPVFSHIASDSAKAEVVLSGVDSPVFNENPDMRYCVRRNMSRYRLTTVPGMAVVPFRQDELRRDYSWHWMNPGLKVHPVAEQQSGRDFLVPGPKASERHCYRVAPGRRYSVKIDLTCQAPGPRMRLDGQVYGSDLKMKHNIEGATHTLQQGRQSFEELFEIPRSEAAGSIYDDPNSNTELQLTVAARMQDMNCIYTVHAIELRLEGAEAGTREPSLIIQGQDYAKPGKLAEGSLLRLPLKGNLPERYCVDAQAQGSGRLSWLLRLEGPLWQVRNAPGHFADGILRLGPLRNRYTKTHEIICTPLFQSQEPYVRSLGNVNRVDIHPYDPESSSLEIMVTECLAGEQATAEVRCGKEPVDIKGATDSTYQQGVLNITLLRGKKAILKFS